LELKNQYMKKLLLIAAIGLMSFTTQEPKTYTIVLTAEDKIARLQERLTSAEDKDATLFKKLDYISAQLTDLSIQLSNKQDK